MGTRIAVMKDGKIQQIGEPLEIYDRPANLFVAGFVGTPPMNLLPAKFEPDGRRLSGDGFSLPLPPGWTLPAGAAVIVGIRPENLHRALPASPQGARLSLLAEVVEPLGDEVVVHARLGEAAVICKLGPRDGPAMGETFEAFVDADRIHLFDPASGARIDPIR